MDSTQPIGYLNGEFVADSDLKLSVFDQGIVHGFAVTEMLRTFSGRIYQLDAHLNRLCQSARLCGLTLRHQADQIAQICQQIVRHNAALIGPDQDLGLIVSGTAGLNPTYTGVSNPEPTLFAHTFALNGRLWADAIQTGQHLAVSQVPQVPDACLPANAKSRSRLPWLLADADVKQRYPQARAIVLDQYGYVCETSTANLFVVRDSTLHTPPAQSVLPGVSRQVVLELADALSIRTAQVPLTIDDLLQAEEIFTTSTPYCLLGVSKLNSTAAGLQFPGSVTQTLLERWNELVGVDIHQQLLQMTANC